MTIELMPQPLKVLYNPEAGNVRSLSTDVVENYLTFYDLWYEWVTVEDLKRLPFSSQSHYHVLVIGGDGTLHQLLNTIGAENLSRFTLGIIPTGTGNDFARSLNIPLEVGQAFEAFMKGQAAKVDLGMVNQNVCFSCAVSFGFGPEVTRHATRRLKKWLGRWALYWGAGLYFLHRKPHYSLRMRMDNGQQKRIRTLQFVVGNAKYHGGGFQITPRADLRSGALDVYYVKPLTFWQLCKFSLRLCKARDAHPFSELQYERAKAIDIRLPSPVALDIDGDIYYFQRHLMIQVFPQALQVVVPQTGSAQHKSIQNPSRKFMGRKRRAS